MALDPVPWFIGGGAEHSAGVARLLVHVATGGAAGIVSSTDLFVSQKPAPTGLVTVAPGAAIIPNTNAIQQSYALRAPSATDLTIAPTGSASGRSDLVVAYVDDPEFTGQVLPEGQVALGPYVKFAIIAGVGSTQTTVPDTFDYPALPLARITLPANTAAVAQSHITDLRRIAMPKRTRDLYNTQPSSSSVVTSTSFVAWTPQANRSITIPEWATQVKITGHVGQVLARNASLIGKSRANLGTLQTQETAFNLDANTRTTLLVSDTLAIPAALRGTTQALSLQALRLSGSGNLETDAYSTVLWDIEFLEVASAGLMSDWQYAVSRLSGAGTETVLDWDVPLGDAVLSSALSGPDSMSGTIAPELASLRASDGRALITPWSTALYAIKDDRVRMGCIVTDLRARNSSLAIDGIGFSGYLQGMPYTGVVKDFGGQDPLNAVEYAWAHAQSQSRGNIGLVVENKATKVTLATKKEAEADSSRKTVEMSWETTHDLGKLVDELAVWTPFDYREDHTFSGNAIQHHLRIGYPKLGSKLTNLRFVVGENVIVMPDSIDEGGDYASEVIVLGAGEGSKMVRASVPRTAESRLRRPVIVSDKSLRTPQLVSTRARLELDLRKGLPEIAEIKVIDHPNAPLGAVSPGDEILLQTGPDGWQGDLAFWARVLEVTVRPDDPGSITLSLARVEGV